MAGSSIELFTGGGGLALAMHDVGFRHLLAVEWDRRACDTLRVNVARDHDATSGPAPDIGERWPLVEGDVRPIDFTPWLGSVDVVAGGVPCQPWSLGGVHQGYDDPRNLWPELFRCVRETQPKAVIAENVKGLLRPSFKPYYDYIRRELQVPFEERIDGEDWRDHDKRLQKALLSDHFDPTERYDVTYKLVNAADYGVPQIRQRVFVVAFRKDLGLSDWDIPEGRFSETALWHDQDAWPLLESPRYRVSSRAGAGHHSPARRQVAVADSSRCNLRSAGACGIQNRSLRLAGSSGMARSQGVPRPHSQ